MRFPLPPPLHYWLLMALLLLRAGSPIFAQAPTWQDASNPGFGAGRSTAVDASGNIYVTGEFVGTATFGATTVTSAGGTDVFVAKRTPAGVWQWATSVGGTSDDGGLSVAVDGSSSVVITGAFASRTIDFGTTTLTNAGLYDVFVAKLTPTGAWQWATSAGGSNSDRGVGVALDGNDNVVITGSFASPTVVFGATTLTNVGLSDIFVAKLTPTGVWQWATGTGDIYNEDATSVAVDGSGDVVITGNFESATLSFGTTTLANANPNRRESDIFVAKLTSTGVWQWAASAGGNEIDVSLSVAVDGSGNVVITGSFYGPTLTFGTTTLTNASVRAYDMFVAKLTPTGTWQWATSAENIYDEFGRSVAMDGSGSVVVTGYFSGTITFGSTTLTGAGDTDIFVAKLSPVGTWQWATSVGGSGDDYVFGMAASSNSSVVITGVFASPSLTFGATTLTYTVFPSFYFARLSGTTGLPDTANQPPLTLAPNPARTTVQLTGATGPTATLLDGLGRVVGTVPVSPAGAATLDVRALPAGLYLLRTGRATRRLVVD